MPTAFSHLAGREVSTSSPEWQRECECRFLLQRYPTRELKHRFLYGVKDRSDLFEVVETYQDGEEKGEIVLKKDHEKMWDKRHPPVMRWRGLEEADRLLADAKRLYDLTQKQS